MKSTPENYAFEWVVIPKRRLYLIIAAALLAAAALSAFVYQRARPGASAAARPPGRSTLLTSTEGEVRVIRAGTREVQPATTQTTLQPGDTLQTNPGSRARVALPDGSSLSVSENSVVTIAEDPTAPQGAPPPPRVVVESGLVAVLTEDAAPGAQGTITTPLTSNHVSARTRASFGVSPGRADEIRVSEGRIETTTRSGLRATLAGGEYASVDTTGSITRREPLLDTPFPFDPPNLSVVGARNDPPLRLRWSTPDGARAADYQLQVASSPFFVPQGIFLDRPGLRLPHLILSSLRPGPHFWRVRARSASGQLSPWSESSKFTVAVTPQRP